MYACRSGVRRLGGLRPGLFGFGRAFGFRVRLRVDGQRRDAEYGQVEQYDCCKPTFDVPEEVDRRYTLTASAENAEERSANVTVRVLNKEPLSLICTPVTVYEGSADFALDCSASGAPSGSDLRLRVDGQRRDAEYGQVEQYDCCFDVPEEVASERAVQR